MKIQQACYICSIYKIQTFKQTFKTMRDNK